MQIHTRQIDSLTPYARNSRTHTPAQIAQIAASIREFGMAGAIIIRGDTIAKGHGTLAAIALIYQSGDLVYPVPGKAAGAEPFPRGEAPTIDATGWTDNQFRAYVIADNQLALNAGWDNAVLAGELRDLIDASYDVGVTGFDLPSIRQLIAGLDIEPGLTDPELIPPLPKIAKAEPADVWILGRNRLMCGDSTSPDDVQTLMNGHQADLVWTDPPYNIAYVGKTKEKMTIANDSMADAAFRDFMAAVYTRYFDAMKPGAVIYVAHADTERVTFAQQFAAAGLKLSQVLVWVKQSATLSRQDFNWRHEPILYGWKEGAGHYFCGDFTRTTVIEDDIDFDAMKKADLIALLKQSRAERHDTVIRHDRPTKSELHPTMKPVGLVEKMIDWSSKPGDIVLDLFGGSGTTLIASEMTARLCYLMELDPKYCDVIIRRWQQFTGKTAIHAATGAAFPS